MVKSLVLFLLANLPFTNPLNLIIKLCCEPPAAKTLRLMLARLSKGERPSMSSVRMPSKLLPEDADLELHWESFTEAGIVPSWTPVSESCECGIMSIEVFCAHRPSETVSWSTICASRGFAKRELAARLHIQRMARVERAVEHVGRVRALGEREFDRVLFVGLAPPVVALVQLESG